MKAHRHSINTLLLLFSLSASAANCEYDIAPATAYDSCQPLKVVDNYGANFNPEESAFTLCLGRVMLSKEGAFTTVLQVFQNGRAWNPPLYLQSFTRGPNNDFGQGSGHWKYRAVDGSSQIAIFPSNRLANKRVDQCDGVRSIHYSHSDWPYPGYISFSVGSQGAAMPCVHEGSLPVFSEE